MACDERRSGVTDGAGVDSYVNNTKRVAAKLAGSALVRIGMRITPFYLGPRPFGE